MSETVLPRQIDPIQFTEKKIDLEGAFKVGEMERLSEIVCDKDGVVSFNLSFGKDAEGIRLIQGNVRSAIKVICQRCLEPLVLDLDLKVKLSPVLSAEAARQLPEEYDPLLLLTEVIPLITIIEDEILVNIPSFPKHEKQKCSVKLDDLLEKKTKKQQNDDNPFKVLENLIKKR